MQLLLVGANYKSAGLATREPLTFDKAKSQALLATLVKTEAIEEVILLSTCNRSEVYAIVSDPAAARQSVVSALCQHAQMQTQQLESLIYTYYNKFAATHLFEVAAGLDSMVLGENEILRQVKNSLETAQSAQTCGSILHQLFRFAITAGKRVRAETQINQGCSSMSALAARLLRDTLSSQQAPRLLILGAGQMARTLVRSLKGFPVQILLANRTPQHAHALAEDCAAELEILSLNRVSSTLKNIDAVVTCTAVPDFLITPAELTQRQDSSQPLLMVDLSVPRNIDPAVTQLPGVQLYDVDSLQAVVSLSLEQRQHYVAQAHSIIGEETTRFLDWFHNREMVPTIQGLYQTFEEIRQREIVRGTQKYKDILTPESEALLERITRAITQKILHYPVVRLKSAPPHEQQIYHEALSELFGLNAEDEIDKYVHFPSSAQVPARSAPAHP